MPRLGERAILDEKALRRLEGAEQRVPGAKFRRRGAHSAGQDVTEHSFAETFAPRLRDLGAKVTPYGDGMVERVRELAGGAPDFALHTARVKGVLPDLVKIVDGDPHRVMSFSDFDEGGLGVRTTGREEGVVHRYDVLPQYAQLCAEGRFTIPIARTFALEDWPKALDLSLNNRAHGKLVLLPDRAA
jgi:NADPH:quinone reductase-like Zn-dependent oxidoreductase